MSLCTFPFCSAWFVGHWLWRSLKWVSNNRSWPGVLESLKARNEIPLPRAGCLTDGALLQGKTVAVCRILKEVYWRPGYANLWGHAAYITLYIYTYILTVNTSKNILLPFLCRPHLQPPVLLPGIANAVLSDITIGGYNIIQASV